MSDSIKVAIKVRPLIKREKEDNLSIQWTVQGNSIVATDAEVKKRGDGGFYFDHIFDSNATNYDVFDSIVKPIVNAAVNGFNGTVFAYGQTSSGKTYTMMGTLEEPGVIPLAVEHIFTAIADTVGREFLLRVSYVEIYNEKVNDLLNKTGIDLKLHEDGTGQVVMKCKEEVTNSPDNVLAIMRKGDKNRRIGETNMNERSSRSHTIFRITIESREAEADSDGAIQVSQLNLVDLAGSERARQTGATGERFKEGRHINLSLSTLGLVIKQLSEAQDGQKHVNFRDSKLTRLLQASLGGNAMTAIICAVTPAAFEETQCTLMFASRAKSVKNKPELNEVMSDTALLKRYARQLAKLNAELAKLRNENRLAEVEEMESKLLEKDRANQILEERIELLKTKIVTGESTNHEESFKCKSRRRRTWGGPSTLRQHQPIFQTNAGLPTIKEMSPEKPFRNRKSIIQSVNIMDQTFQTAFTDFELELLESERSRDTTRDDSDCDEEPYITKRNLGHRVTFRDDVLVVPQDCDNYDQRCDVTPEKKNKQVQTQNLAESPSTPKHILRETIHNLAEKYDILREFSTLEKQVMSTDARCEDCQKYFTVKENTEPVCKNLIDISINFESADTCKSEDTSSELKGLLEMPEIQKQIQGLGLKENDSITTIVTTLCKQLEKGENKMENLTSPLESKKESDYVTENNHLKDYIKNLESIINNVKNEYKNLEKNLVIQKESTAIAENKCKSFEAQCTKQEVLINNLEGQNKSLQEQLKNQTDYVVDMQNKNKTLRKQLMEKEESIRSMQECNNNLENRCTNQEVALKNLRLENNNLQEKLTKQTEFINCTKKDRDNKEDRENIKKHEELEENDEMDTTDLNEHFNDLEFSETTLDASKLIVDLEHDKAKLSADLEIKNRELREIKNDVQSLKLDIVKLDKTIQMLTNENMELSNILSTEKDLFKNAELTFQKTIKSLRESESKWTNEKIALETELQTANEQLTALRSKLSEPSINEEELRLQYEDKIEKLKAENIELASKIAEKIKELENIKESKSLRFEHDCIYKDKSSNLVEDNKRLALENEELSTDLMDKIEENDILKKECDSLKEKLKLSLANIANSAEDDMEQLRVENNMLKVQVMELKTKVATLSDENTKFSNNLLETIEDLDNSRCEMGYNNPMHLSTVFDGTITSNQVLDDVIKTGSRDTLVKEILKLKAEVNHVTCLNEKLSDLKLKTCSQCAHLQSMKEDHRALKLESKNLGHRMRVLQEQFERKCAEIETLKTKANQSINLSQLETSLLNSSVQDALSVSFVQEKIEVVSNELQTLKEANDELSSAYREKCEEFDKLQEKSATAKDDSKPKKQTHKSEMRYDEIQNHIVRVAEDIDGIKHDMKSFNKTMKDYKEERASLMKEIDMLKDMNETLAQNASDHKLSASIATEKAQLLESEVLNLSRDIQQYLIREKEYESEKVTLEVEMENLRTDKKNSDEVIAKLHKMTDELNESISRLKSELDALSNERNELLTSKEEVEHKHNVEILQLKKQCEELETEKLSRSESEKLALSKAAKLESDLQKLQSDLMEETNTCNERLKRISELEQLLDGNNRMKESLEKKLEEHKVELSNTERRHKDELDCMANKLADRTKEHGAQMKIIKETLNNYIQENNSLRQELVKLRDLTEEYNKNEDQSKSSLEQSLMDDNKSLKDELNSARECIIKELKSLKHKSNTMDLLSKSVNEIFVIFLQTIISKEEEIVKTMREQFEKDKQKLEDEKRQSEDSEKRAKAWVKTIEADFEKLQTDLTHRERMYHEHKERISELNHLLRESNHEKDMLKEKMETLESEFNNLQTEFDKQCKKDTHQESAILVAQKREKEAQEAFRVKEAELESKLKSEREMYENRIQDLSSMIELYKTKNMELKSSIEGLEANEKQFKNVLEANATEFKKNDQTIQMLNKEIDQLTEAYNEVQGVIEEKNMKIEDLTAALKSKCDLLFECKSKLDNIMPDYEQLQEQVKERKVNIERYKEEIEALRIEKEKQMVIIQDKLNSEEVKNAGLQKQLIDLSNRNTVLITELNDLKEKYEQLQQDNAKLERKMRNSTSKIRAEAEIDDLRDMNKRLQSNLDGASNRITELQENKNQLLRDLGSLKVEYDLLSQENSDLKQTVASYKSKQNISLVSKNDDRYEELLHDKNKIALELEGKKLLLSQKDRELEKYMKQIEKLTKQNKELDQELDEYAAVIRERTDENTLLADQLYEYTTNNKLVIELQEKIKIVQDDNEKYKKQIEELKTQNDKLCKDVTTLYALKKENLELHEKIADLENKSESRSSGSGSRCTSPAFENIRRRHSRNEIFNQRRQLDNIGCDTEFDDAEEKCRILRNKIRELELDLVSKNGKIATLEVQIQSESFPYHRKCKELEENLLAYRKLNAELKAEVIKLQRTRDEINSWECETCRRWRLNRTNQACQTISTTTVRFGGITSGVVEDYVVIAKLEKQHKMAKELCRSRSRRIKELEERIKELEEAQNSFPPNRCSPKGIESTTLHLPSAFPDRQHETSKMFKSVMKENVPPSILNNAAVSSRRKY